MILVVHSNSNSSKLRQFPQRNEKLRDIEMIKGSEKSKNKTNE